MYLTYKSSQPFIAWQNTTSQTLPKIPPSSESPETELSLLPLTPNDCRQE